MSLENGAQTEKIVRMEDILKSTNSNETTGKAPQKSSNLKKQLIENNTIKGKTKSGRFWKADRKKFSSIIKTRGLKNSLEKKQILREKLRQVKEASRERKAKKQEEEEQRKQRRRDNLKRQEENRKKSEIVQVISNTKKLKKMKKKQLRYIEKRDTTIISK